MRLDGNQGSTLGYEPNSYGEWQEQPGFREPSLALDGTADHWNHRQDEDYYSQPGLLFRLMNPQQRKVLFENTARAMGDAAREIKLRHINNCRNPTRPTVREWRRRSASRQLRCPGSERRTPDDS